MHVRFIVTTPAPVTTGAPADIAERAAPSGPETVEDHHVDQIPALLRRRDGILWVDIPQWSDEAETVLRTDFGFHPLAIDDCRERRQVPKVHVYADHVFIVLHAPQPGPHGHVHYIELDQFVGAHYIVTVHGPLNPVVDPQAALVEVDLVRRRLDTGRFRPQEPFDVSHALVSALCGRLRDDTAGLTREVWALEKRVADGRMGDVETFLEDLFHTRHGLLTVGTMAALSREVFLRMANVEVFGPGRGHRRLTDIVDQFDRLAAMARIQQRYLQGTIEFYQTRTETKMTIAAERLGVIAAVTLPITALSSVLGMNLIVNDATTVPGLITTCATMLIMCAGILWWAHRKGWW